MNHDTVVFPRRSGGRQTLEAQAQFQHQLYELRNWMIRYHKRLGCAVSARGWCYALEQAGAITKDEFEKAGQFISDQRKAGNLPLDLVADDNARAMQGWDFYDDCSPKEYLVTHLRRALDQAEKYRPVSFWTTQTYYPIVMVEKSDLVSLFRQVLPQAVKIFNARGNADVNSRVKLLETVRWALSENLEPVILYAGDHDPSGLLISDGLKSWGVLGEIAKLLNMEDELRDLRIVRFALNQRQIEEGGFIKIPNLVTSQGKDLADPNHKDYNKPYVQNYLRTFGAWKVEANALVANPEYGRQLMHDALFQWLDQEGIDLWEEANNEEMQRTRAAADNVRRWLAALEKSGMLFNEMPLITPQEAQTLIQRQLPEGSSEPSDGGPVVDI